MPGEPSPGAAPAPALNFEIQPEDVARLLRSPVLASRRAGRAKTSALNTVWHDTAGGDLAARSLTLGQARGLWRLEKLLPNGAMDWLPATPAPLVAEAASRDQLGCNLPSPLAPVAAFNGRLRDFQLEDPSGEARLSILDGTLRGVVQDKTACHLILSGDRRGMALLARELSEIVTLSVPRAGLAAQAIAVARGQPAPARHMGAPSVPSGLSIDAALAFITAHLADVILHWAALIPNATTQEPVRQMRVGVRRLRSALSIFRRAAQGPDKTVPPWLQDLSTRLKELAGQLGHARDWDVFLSETGADVQDAFPDDRRIAQMMAAADRRRGVAYEDLADVLTSRVWQRLELSLALLPTLRPWLTDGPETLTGPIDDYAALALNRRLKHVLSAGPDLTDLPVERLHEARKQAKRLRYATEFFADLFPDKTVRRYLPKLEDLQEDLGAVNDTAVAASLTGELGSGADRAFASGVVQGFCAGTSRRAVGRAQRSWSKFYRADPFWA